MWILNMVGAIFPIVHLFIFSFVFACLFVVVFLFFFYDDQDDLCNQETLILRFDFSKDLGLEF